MPVGRIRRCKNSSTGCPEIRRSVPVRRLVKRPDGFPHPRFWEALPMVEVLEWGGWIAGQGRKRSKQNALGPQSKAEVS